MHDPFRSLLSSTREHVYSAFAILVCLAAGSDSVTAAAEGRPANAPPITGVPGSPTPTTTISGEQLPALLPEFRGVMKRNTAASKPYWPAPVVPPKGAPNVLLIMTNNVGFGAPFTFGGLTLAPTLDRVADDRQRYTNFHSTAL